MCRPYRRAIRELEHRQHDNVDMKPLWKQPTNRLFFEARDKDTGLSVTVDVDGASAAFHHSDQHTRRSRGATNHPPTPTRPHKIMRDIHDQR
jgi:hypothetical protein